MIDRGMIDNKKEGLLLRRAANIAHDDLKSMTVDELWALHVEVTTVLGHRISAEKRRLEQLLQQLNADGVLEGSQRRERRPYPQVFPKYRNPAKPTETWAGRGKQPRWLRAELRAGKKIEDFRIPRSTGKLTRKSATRR